MHRRSAGIIAAVAAAPLFTVASGCGGDVSGATPPPSPATTIGIIQIVSHPALDAAIDGFREGMADAGFGGLAVTSVACNAEGEASAAAGLAREPVAPTTPSSRPWTT